MNAFYKLACALVAWSSLSLTANALPLDSLASLPQQAFTVSALNPDRLSYIKPDTDFARYQRILIEPLALLTKDQDDWNLQVISPESQTERYFQQAFAETLRAQGLDIAHEPTDDAMRLRLALSLGSEASRLPCIQQQHKLTGLTDGMDHYMAQVLAVGQLEDARTGALLAGSAEISAGLVHQQARLAERNMHSLIDNWAHASAEQLAMALDSAHTVPASA